jgi:hypothetical protein
MSSMHAEAQVGHVLRAVLEAKSRDPFDVCDDVCNAEQSYFDRGLRFHQLGVAP